MTEYWNDWRGGLRVLLLGGLLLSLQACDEGVAEDGPTLQTTTSLQGDLRITAEANGLVEPIRVVEVKSKAGGEVLALHVDIGDQVTVGQVLAEIDPRDVRNAYDQAEADLEAAQARLDVSQAAFNRSARLVETGVITQQDHENATLDLANARTALVRAVANEELADLRLADVRIVAATSGTILTKTVEVGTVIQSASGNVSGGTVLFTMASLSEMQVRTLIDETDMGQIQAGLESLVTVEAYPDRQFVGEVKKIEPQAEVQSSVTMFPVIVTLDNSSGLLRPGMNAEVEIYISEALNVILAPNGAIVDPNDGAPAAEVLGLDPTQYNFRNMPIGAVTARPPAEAESDSAEGAPDLASVRAMVESGEITQDSARALFAAAGRGARGQGGGGRGGFGGPGGGNVGNQGVRPTVQRAVVFVVNADGTIEPRGVQIGLNDWDNTQVIAGLEAGEQLALIGAAQLQAQRQAQLDRFRERAGGIIPGAGGGGRGR